MSDYTSWVKSAKKITSFNVLDLKGQLKLSLEEGNLSAARVYASELNRDLSKKEYGTLLRVNIQYGNVAEARAILRNLHREELTPDEKIAAVRGAVLLGKIRELCKLTRAGGANGKAYLQTCLMIAAAKVIRRERGGALNPNISLSTWETVYRQELHIMRLKGKHFTTPFFPDGFFWILSDKESILRAAMVLIGHNLISEREIDHITGKQ